MKRESKYQSELIKTLKDLFPGIVILKNDPSYQQGILDLSLFFGQHWAMLEVKSHEKAKERPNQGYYVDKLNEMSFAAFIYPENEAEVLHELQLKFSD